MCWLSIVTATQADNPPTLVHQTCPSVEKMASLLAIPATHRYTKGERTRVVGCSYNTGDSYDVDTPPAFYVLRGASTKPGEVTDSTAGVPSGDHIHHVDGVRKGKYVIVKQHTAWYTLTGWCRVRRSGFVSIGTAQTTRPTDATAVKTLKTLCH
jgi:hypothetical protein